MASADVVLARLRAEEPTLRAAGIARCSIFGSVARGDDHERSDVDLLVLIGPEERIGLFELVDLEKRLSDLLERKVHLTTEPIENPYLRRQIERDQQHVF